MNQKKSLLILALALVVLVGGGWLLYGRLAQGLAHDQLAVQDTTPPESGQPAETGTQPPQPVVAPDFTVYDGAGNAVKLSDFRGKPVVINFWASWCGPCIRETKVLKEIYEEYGPKGLDVLGVAVWDEPANTLKAIEQHQLPWPQIINAQTIPTDLYGIAGIPCIILFDPEGNIVSRDKQDDDLRADVAAAMAKVAAPAVK